MYGEGTDRYGIDTEAYIKSIAAEPTGDVTISAGVSMSGLTEYADNAAAIAGGLVAGDLYTTSGSIKIVV